MAFAALRPRPPLVALAIALATACGTKTSTTQLWQAQDYSAPAPMRRIIVFAGGMAEAERRSLEDRIALELEGRGVAATPSYRLFPTLPETGLARAEVQAQGFDGALVSTMRSVYERPTYVPGYFHGGGFWSGYYGHGWGPGWTPGYVETDEIVGVETSVWDLRKDGGELVWSASTQTTNPSSRGDFVESLAKAIVPKIADAGLVPRER